jgi:AhpD family alkylhydroperoxidase
MSIRDRLVRQESRSIWASQINGCAVGLALHIADARKNGESEERIYLLDAFRESPLFTERERAALEWTEALTRLAPGGVSDAAYAALKAQFSEGEQVALTPLVGAINAWNRLNVGFRVRPFVPAEARAA